MKSSNEKNQEQCTTTDSCEIEKTSYIINEDKILRKQTIINPYNYKAKNKSLANVVSMGLKKGMFKFPNISSLYHYMIKNNKLNTNSFASNFCFVDMKTEYFILFWDFDIDDKVKFNDITSLQFFTTNHIDYDAFWKYVIKYVLKAIRYYIKPKKSICKYIYSDRSDKMKYKLHLYFPNIIVNSNYAIAIRNKVLELLLENNIYNVAKEHLDKILDCSVYKNFGLRFMYQRKVGESGYYKINKTLSTYKKIPKDKIKQLQLTSLKTSATNINFEKKVCKKRVLLDEDVKKIDDKKKKRTSTKPKNKNVVINKNIVLLEDTYDHKYVTALVDNLSMDRIQKHETWIKLMLMLGNYGWSDLAHKTSKRDTVSGHYKPYEVDKLMQKGCNTTDPLTVDSLKYWSEIDNNEEHLKILEKYDSTDIEKCFKIDMLNNNTFSDDYIDALIDNIDFGKCNFKTFVFLCANYGWTDRIERCRTKTKYSEIYVNKLLKYASNKGNTLTLYSLRKWSKISNRKQHKLICHKFDGSPTKYRYPIEHLNSHFRQMTSTHTYQFDQFNNYKQICVSFLKDLDLSKFNTILIKSGTGTNKTGCVIKAIVELATQFKLKRITCMASRVCLCNNLSGRFMKALYGEEDDNRPIELGMVNYYDVKKKKTLYKYARLIITPDSSIHLVDKHNRRLYPDFLFVDEVESMFEYITNSKTLSDKRRRIYNIFINFIKRAKYVIMVDSNLSEHTCKKIIELRGKDNVQIIHNTKMTDNHNYYIKNNECEWMDMIYKDLDEDHNLYICTDSKDQSEIFYNNIIHRYPHLKVIKYNSDTKHEHKIDLKDVNKIWSRYNCVIVSPTVDYGIDFGVLNHFYKVYCWVQATILPQTAFQQIRRVRHLLSGEVYIYVKEYVNYKITYPTDIETLKTSLLQHRGADVYKGAIDSLSVKDDEEGYEVLDIDDHYTDMYLYFIKLRHKALNNYKKELVYYLTEYGGSVYMEISKKIKNEKYEKNKEEIMNFLEKDKINKMIKASTSIINVEKLQRKMLKTEDDINALQCAYIQKIFGLGHLTAKFIKFLGHSSHIDAYDESLIYHDNIPFKDYCIKQLKKNETNVQFCNKMEQTDLLKELIGMYWKDGLFSNETIRVYTGKGSLTEKEIMYLDKNESKLRLLFKSVRGLAKPKYSYSLVKWLGKMIGEYFGGFVSMMVSKQKDSVKKGKRMYYYDICINSLKYIELILNNGNEIFDVNTFDKIIKLYGDCDCEFFKLLKCKKIKNLQKNIKNKYMFDD